MLNIVCFNDYINEYAVAVIFEYKEKNYEKTDYFRYACLRDDLRCVLVNGMRD